jgi:hypothetical protein
VPTIAVKGKAGVASDENGNFSIEVDENATIEISFVGYQSQKIKITTKTNLNIILQKTTSDLGEVVVVGYGKQARAKLTSSVSVIKTDQFKDAPYTNIPICITGQGCRCSGKCCWW